MRRLLSRWLAYAGDHAWAGLITVLVPIALITALIMLGIELTVGFHDHVWLCTPEPSGGEACRWVTR